MTWHQDAACRGLDPALFFPDKGEDTAPAKAVCQGCDVREECLNEALANDELSGIFGGMSGRQRARLIRSKPVVVRCLQCGAEIVHARHTGVRAGVYVRICSDECRAQRHRDQQAGYLRNRRSA